MDEKYTKLAEELTAQEVQVIGYLQGSQHLIKLQQKIEAQAPKCTELISQYSTNQYVDQTIEVMPGLDVQLRTLSPFAVDESMRFAKRESETDLEYSRQLARRRLAHGLIAINGNQMSSEQIDGDLLVFASADKEFKSQLVNRADIVYSKLEFMGLADKISEAFGTWEKVIYNRMNGIEDIGETLKKSTGASESGQ